MCHLVVSWRPARAEESVAAMPAPSCTFTIHDGTARHYEEHHKQKRGR